MAWEGAAPAEPNPIRKTRLGRSLALPKQSARCLPAYRTSTRPLCNPIPKLSKDFMPDFVDPSIARPRLVRKRIVSALVIAVESVGVIGLTALLLSGRLMDALVVLQLMMAVALPLAVMWATVRRHRSWHQPLGQLQDLIPKVRDGLEPIESLANVGGKLAPLAAMCQQMLRDVREEKLRIAQLKEEVRQRIASRTEALERRIGALQQQAARDGLTGLYNRRAL